MARPVWNGNKGRGLSPAGLFGEGAAGIKIAAGSGQVRGDLAFEYLPVRPVGGLNFRDGRHQGDGIGMKGVVKKLINGRLLDDSAHIHHRHNVAGKLDYRKVMSDKKIRQGKLLLKVFEEVQDLGLNRDIERADGFITDNKFGLQSKGTGYAYSLTLAP